MSSLINKRIEKWKKIIQENLGKKVSRRSHTLIFNLLAVDHGIKPAYLYDIGEPLASDIFYFIHAVKEAGLISNNLNVIKIGMDCVVVNVDVLKSWTRNSKFLSRRLIDISGGNKKPCVYDGRQAVEELVTVFTSIVKNLEADKVMLCDVTDSTPCNISTLYGLLLDYPVLYWYDTSMDDSANCLSMEKLMCVGVDMKYEYTDSVGSDPDSYPMNCPHSDSFNNHRLYLFSYPACLEHSVKPLVHDWFQVLEEKVQQSRVFFEAKISFEENILEAVSL